MDDERIATQRCCQGNRKLVPKQSTLQMAAIVNKVFSFLFASELTGVCPQIVLILPALPLTMPNQSGDFTIYLWIFITLIVLSVITWVITKRDLLRNFIWVLVFILLAFGLIAGTIGACNRN